MKKLIALAFVAIILTSCGGSTTPVETTTDTTTVKTDSTAVDTTKVAVDSVKAAK
jgi:PBP1b-binding outer membrane lipoprotein LpoB